MRGGHKNHPQRADGRTGNHGSPHPAGHNVHGHDEELRHIARALTKPVERITARNLAILGNLVISKIKIKGII
jgi:hypothetical protein